MLCQLASTIPVLVTAGSVLRCNATRLQSLQRCIAVPFGPVAVLMKVVCHAAL